MYIYIVPLSVILHIHRVIHKSLRDFRSLLYRSRDGHAEGEHVNRRRDTPSFCPNLQVLNMSTLGDAADINSVIKFLSHTLQYVAGTWLQYWHLPRHLGWTYRAPVRQDRNLRVSLPLLTCSPSAWPSRLLYRRGRKSRRDLWIILYV